jgi:hypothetical protein
MIMISTLYKNKTLCGIFIVLVHSNNIAGDLGFDPRSSQTEDYNIGICCFSTKHAALRSKSKDRLARNQDNVSEWSIMYIRGLLFPLANTMKKT